MNESKRPRATRSKLQKGLTAKGAEFYYSKRPYAKKADFVVTKAKPLNSEARPILKKKSKS